jgi:nuclear pore complex protein Nup107
LSVLQAASWILKPDYFTEAMDLAVALTEKEWLNKTFQETGRVRELVQRLADVSASSLLSAKQDKKEAKVSKLGHTRAIWDPNRQ